jgi:hypothetical protein
MVEMSEQQVRNIGRIDVNSHQLPGRSMTAIDQEMAAIAEGEEDRGVAAFRVRQRSASPQHDNLHCIVPFS